MDEQITIYHGSQRVITSPTVGLRSGEILSEVVKATRSEYKSTFTHFDSTGYLKPPSIAIRKIDRKETYILLNINLISQLEYTRSIE